MLLIAICVAGFCFLIFGLVRLKQLRDSRELDRHSIEPEELHTLLESGKDLLLFDVRQPLDLLAHAEIIPGSTRLAPKEVIDHPASIPKDRDSVIYCTCESQKTSRWILRKALSLHITRIKFLKGGLAGWKAKGFPVEAYTKSFHLDTAV